VYVAGDEQPAKADPSTLHANVTLFSVAVKLKFAERLLTVPVGPPVMLVSGGPVSTVQLRVAGVASTLPVLSVARTWKVCVPSARAL